MRLTKHLKEANERDLKEALRQADRQTLALSRALADSRRARRKVILKSPPPRKHTKDQVRIALGDSHGSIIDPRAAGAALADVRALKPKTIVLLGDHIDCGGFLAQHHVMGFVAETEYSYSDDLEAANSFLDQLQEAAPEAEIHYIEGNHERRIETWCVTQTLRHQKDAELLRKAFAPEFSLRLADRGISYYRQSVHYHGLTVPGAIRLGKCHFWHGTSCAKHAASVNLSQIAGNVVYGHTHREDTASRRPVATGDIGAWTPGCLCRQQPLWQHTRPTDWTHGIALQLVAPSGNFLHVNVKIIDGSSLLQPLLKATNQ